MVRWTAILTTLALVGALGGCAHRPSEATAPLAVHAADPYQDWLSLGRNLCSNGPPSNVDVGAWAHWCGIQYQWFDAKPYRNQPLVEGPPALPWFDVESDEPLPDGSHLAARDLDLSGEGRARSVDATPRPSTSDRSRGESRERQRSSDDRQASPERDRDSSSDDRRR